MKLTSYSPTVAQSNIQTHVANAGDIKSYAANTTGVDALNKGIGGINALVVKAVEDKDITNIANANTEYSKRIDDLLYNNDSGLILKQELGADGITDTFEAEEKKIREDVLGKFHFSLGKSRQGLIGNMNNIAASRYNLTAKHESTQLEKGKDTALTNYINTKSVSAEQNYDNDVIINQSADDIRKAVAVRFAGQDPEYINKMTNAELSKFYTSLYSVAANSNDNVRALDILNNHADLFPEQQRAALIGKNFAIQESDLTLKFINGLPELFDFYSADGVQKAKDYTKATYEYDVGGSGLGLSVDKLNGFYKETEGMKYALGGAEDGSGGTYDCGSWTKNAAARCGVKFNSRTADGQYIELMHKGLTFTDESQLRDGDFVFWHTTDKWGYTDNENETDKAYKGITHVGIYAGNGKVYQAGSSSGVSTTDLHSMKIVGFGHTGGAGRVRRKPSDSELEKIYASIDAKAAQLQRQKRAADNDVYKKIYDEITDTHATTQAEIDSIIARNAQTQDQRRYASQHFRAARSMSGGGVGGGGSSGGGGYGMTAETMFGIKDLILSGKIENAAEVAAVSEGMKESDRKQVFNLWENTTKTGGNFEEKIKAAVNALGWDNTPTSQIAKENTRQAAVDFVFSRGGNVTDAEIIEFVTIAATKPKVDSKHWYLRDQETTAPADDLTSGKLRRVPNKPGFYEWNTKDGKKYGNLFSYQQDKINDNLE